MSARKSKARCLITDSTCLVKCLCDQGNAREVKCTGKLKIVLKIKVTSFKSDMRGNDSHVSYQTAESKQQHQLLELCLSDAV